MALNGMYRIRGIRAMFTNKNPYSKKVRATHYKSKSK